MPKGDVRTVLADLTQDGSEGLIALHKIKISDKEYINQKTEPTNRLESGFLVEIGVYTIINGEVCT